MIHSAPFPRVVVRETEPGERRIVNGWRSVTRTARHELESGEQIGDE